MKRSFLVIAVLGVFFISVGMKPKKSAPSYKQKTIGVWLLYWQYGGSKASGRGSAL